MKLTGRDFITIAMALDSRRKEVLQNISNIHPQDYKHDPTEYQDRVGYWEERIKQIDETTKKIESIGQTLLVKELLEDKL